VQAERRRKEIHHGEPAEEKQKILRRQPIAKPEVGEQQKRQQNHFFRVIDGAEQLAEDDFLGR
jgi:hypothetical protein